MKKLLVLIAVTAACGGSPSQPSGQTYTITYRTVLSGAQIDEFSQAFCMHDSAPNNLTVHTDTQASVRLQSTGRGSYTGTLSGLSTGTHWLYMTDIGLCVETASPWATRGFELNGVALSRTTDAAGVPAVLFMVRSDGTIAP